MRKEWTREKCIQALNEYIVKNHRLPPSNATVPGVPSSPIFISRVGQTYQQYAKENFPDVPITGGRKSCEWTRESIRAATDAFYEKYQRRPKMLEHVAKNSLPSHNTIQVTFNMTAAEYWDTFYPQTKSTTWSEDEFLNELKCFQDQNGYLPNLSELDHLPQMPSSYTVRRIYGGRSGYEGFLSKHFHINVKQPWTQESAIHAVRSYCKKTGRLPRICDYGRANNLPAITTLYKLFPRQRLTEIYEQYFPEYHRNWSARAHREHTNRIWSQESILKAIDTFYTNTGRFPKAAEFKAKNELPGTSTVYEAFPGEGFQTIFERYFPERTPAERTHKWTPEKILTSICNFYRETGKFPATRDFCSKNHLPSTETVYRMLVNNVSSDSELGVYLVDKGITPFPERFKPYINYAHVGAEYREKHGGAYSNGSYVQKKTPELLEKEKFDGVFRIWLENPCPVRVQSETAQITLPATFEQLESARQLLGVDSLNMAKLVRAEALRPYQ